MSISINCIGIKQCLLMLLLNSLFTANIRAQALESNHWYFGYGAGMVFLPNGPAPDRNGITRTIHATASISNAKGELLFYADRNNVYTAAHDTMKNGKNILNSGNLLIAKQPGSSHLYWLFSMEAWVSLTSKCHFHIIDIHRNGGLGEVVFSSTLPNIYTANGMAICDHENGRDKWIIFKLGSNEAFEAVLLSHAGLDISNSVQTIFSGSYPQTFLFLKSSPNSQYLSAVYRHPRNEWLVYEFNPLNGQFISKLYSKAIPTLANEVLFSGFTPSSKIAIISRRNKLLAYDLSSKDSASIHLTELLVDSNPRIGDDMLDLQIGLDGHLYFVNGTYEHQTQERFQGLNVQIIFLTPLLLKIL